MQLFVWALTIAGFTILSSATPVALIPTLSVTPQNATSTTTSIWQTTTSEPGIPLPPSTVTAQVPTSSPVNGGGCREEPTVRLLNKRDPKAFCAW